MFTTLEKRVVLAGLRGIRDKGPLKYRTGICSNLTEALGDEYGCARAIIKKHFEHWPHFSGCETFPVEGSILQYNRHVNKWDGMYGEKRKDLLAFLIKQLEEEINAEEKGLVRA